MGETVVVYHNPRCSKSRAAVELLRAKGVGLEIVEYLKDPPSRQTLEHVIDCLGVKPHAVLRTGESAYAESGLSPASGKDAILDALIKHPILLERPIAIRADRAVIGRPPENVLALLDE